MCAYIGGVVCLAGLCRLVLVGARGSATAEETAELYEVLGRMQLLVIPVTARFLRETLYSETGKTDALRALVYGLLEMVSLDLDEDRNEEAKTICRRALELTKEIPGETGYHDAGAVYEYRSRVAARLGDPWDVVAHFERQARILKKYRRRKER